MVGGRSKQDLIGAIHWLVLMEDGIETAVLRVLPVPGDLDATAGLPSQLY
jgi:hypothetical protein